MLTVISHFSLFPQFAMPTDAVARHGFIFCGKSEIREKMFGATSRIHRLISLNSLFSLSADRQAPAATSIQNHVFGSLFCSAFNGAISESQPTPRGHTLRGVPLRGLAGAFRPSTPESEKGKSHENGKS
jgi:hypothetical protein